MENILVLISFLVLHQCTYICENSMMFVIKFVGGNGDFLELRATRSELAVRC